MLSISPIPVAANATFSVVHGRAITENLLTYVTHSGATTLQFYARALPQGHGSVNLLASGQLTYKADVAFVGSYSFTYYTSDGTSTSNDATVTFNTTDAAPMALDAGPYSVTAGQSVTTAVLAKAFDADGDNLTASVFLAPTLGYLSFDSAGNIVYNAYSNTPGGTYSFQYQVNDGALNSNVATITVNVHASSGTGNSPPVAIDQSAYTTSGNPVTIYVLANDSGTSLSVYAVGTSTYQGSAVINGTTVTYTPPTSTWSGTDRFSYTIVDAYGSTATGYVSVHVAAATPNGVPVANALSIALDQDTTYTGWVTGSDVDGDTLHYSVVANYPQTHGSLTLYPSGQFTYRPFAGYNTSDSFQFKAVDSAQNFSTATVSIWVRPVVDQPSFSSMADQGIAQGTSFVFSPGITLSDNDAGAGVMTAYVSVATTGVPGILTLGDASQLASYAYNNTAQVTMIGTPSAITRALGGLRYTPTAAYVGLGTVLFSATDSIDGTAEYASAQVNINVVHYNVAPTISVPSSWTTPENTSLVFSQANANLIQVADFDAGAGTEIVSLQVNYGTLNLGNVSGLSWTQLNGTGQVALGGTMGALNNALNGLLYTPPANYSGPVGLSVWMSDNGNTGLGGAQYKTAGIALNVAAPPWIVVPGDQQVSPGGTLVFSKAANNAVTVIDQNPNAGPPTMYVSLKQANSGILTLGSNTGGLSSPPWQNSSSNVGLTGTVQALNDALDGLSFAAAAGFTGVVEIDFYALDTLTNGYVMSASAHVNVLDQPLNMAPTVNMLVQGTMVENTPMVFAPIYGNAISVGDVDAGLGLETVSVQTDHGQLTLGTTAGLSWSYQNGTSQVALSGTIDALNFALNGLIWAPTAGYVGEAGLSVWITDNGNTGRGGPLYQSLGAFWAVTAVADPPVAGNQSLNTLEGVSLSGTLAAADRDGDPLTYALVPGGNSGTVTLSGAGFTYMPALLFTGTDVFTFKANNGHEDGNTATVTITVSSNPADAPIVKDVTATTMAGAPVQINLLANDSDPLGRPMKVDFVDTPTAGTVVMNTDGTIVYTPSAGTASDSFSYTVSDGGGFTSSATVFVNVTAAPGGGPGSPSQAPRVKQTQLYVVAENDQATGLDFNADGIDPRSLPLTMTVLGAPTQGQLVRDPSTGIYTYTANGTSPIGIDTFTFQLSDGTLVSPVVTVSILYYDSSADPLDPRITRFGGSGDAPFGPGNALEADAVQQGAIGGCWFVAAAVSLAEQRPNEIVNMIQDNGNGTYTVSLPGFRLNVAGPSVTIANPAGDGNEWSSSGTGNWLAILEKAYGEALRLRQPFYLRTHVAYDYINTWGYPRAGIEAVTGHSVDHDWFWATADSETRSKLATAVAGNKIVTATTLLNPGNIGLEDQHVYSVLRFDAANDRVLLRNPWGFNVDHTITIDTLSGNQTTTVNLGGIGGAFWLSLTDFTSNFAVIGYEQ